MNQPLVSVVVPIYNVELYLNRCIESIVNQTYSDLEIILVDDGSPDHCPAMCDEWAEKDNRIKVIHKENAGLGMARNTGIENATGKYIFFFDSDDYVDVTIVEKCVLNAEKHDSDVVIYGRYDVYENGKTVKKNINAHKDVFSAETINNELLPAMFTYDMGFGVSAWGKMFNLNTLNMLQQRFLSEREIISEDAYFALEFFSRISTATVINDNLYFYYKRDNSLSRAYRADRQNQNDAFIQKVLDYAKSEMLPQNVTTHITARYHMYTISAMKQVLLSDLSKKCKHSELDKILKSQTLHTTLNSNVLKLHKGTLKVFYRLLKYKCYWLCRALLYYKIKLKGA